MTRTILIVGATGSIGLHAARRALAAGYRTCALVRDRIRAATMVYLDHIAAHPGAWAMPLRRPGSEPAGAARVRARARSDYVERLGRLLGPSEQPRHRYALWGYLGFIDAACLHWVERGCPDEERWGLIDAALGALEGGLGDWAV